MSYESILLILFGSLEVIALLAIIWLAYDLAGRFQQFSVAHEGAVVLQKILNQKRDFDHVFAKGLEARVEIRNQLEAETVSLIRLARAMQSELAATRESLATVIKLKTESDQTVKAASALLQVNIVKLEKILRNGEITIHLRPQSTSLLSHSDDDEDNDDGGSGFSPSFKP